MNLIDQISNLLKLKDGEFTTCPLFIKILTEHLVSSSFFHLQDSEKLELINHYTPLIQKSYENNNCPPISHEIVSKVDIDHLKLPTPSHLTWQANQLSSLLKIENSEDHISIIYNTYKREDAIYQKRFPDFFDLYKISIRFYSKENRPLVNKLSVLVSNIKQVA